MSHPGWFLVVAIATFATASDAAQPQFKITTKRDNDKVDVKVEKDKTVFSIHCPVGISEATIERTNEQWPECVAIRLYLLGLESFQVSNGKISLDAAVSSHTDDKQRVRLWKNGDEDSPLDSKSPCWMEIRMVGGDGKPAKAIPLKDGYFEMQLPKSLFEGNPNSITLTWIDFHRN